MAIGLAHVVFAKLFIEPAKPLLHGVATPDVVAIAAVSLVGGTLFIVTLEAIMAFIHTLRLHWVEWFLKFFAGDGYAFNPLKIGP